jgi:hypothetical protein
MALTTKNFLSNPSRWTLLSYDPHLASLVADEALVDETVAAEVGVVAPRARNARNARNVRSAIEERTMDESRIHRAMSETNSR